MPIYANVTAMGLHDALIKLPSIIDIQVSFMQLSSDFSTLTT